MALYNDQIYLTKEGLNDLKKELAELTEVKRPQMVDRVANARSLGDLSENSDYTTAKEELAMIDGRIDELGGIINRAKIITTRGRKSGFNKIKLGSKVTLKTNNKEHIFTVVGEWEADPLAKKISHDSPLGKALLGKGEGDKVEVEAPVGKIVYHIIKIHH